MFETLVESGNRRRSPGTATATSLAVHVGLAAMAISLTAGDSIVIASRVPQQIMLFEEPPSIPVNSSQLAEAGSLPAPITVSPILPGPISIDPVSIDPAAVVDPTAALRHAIAEGSRTIGIATLNGNRSERPIAGVLLLSEVDEPVKVLKAVSPLYPRTMELAGIAGRVTLQFVVDTAGVVEPGSITVTDSSNTAFVAPSRAAILATRFAPARARGCTVRQLVRQTLLFKSNRE